MKSFPLALVALSLALPAHGQTAPLFKDRAAALPAAQVYDGDWAHFVGGGVALLDCNDDQRPDLFAAGGSNPSRLYINTTAEVGGDITFALAPDGPAFTGVTGAYPLDIDGDGLLDLAVLRAGPNHLLKGLGDCRFEDATDLWSFDAGTKWTTAFAATWEPGRDWPTLAVGNYVNKDDPNGPFEACDTNELHRGAKGAFATPTVIAPGYCALSMLISDWKRTGTPDLRISNDRQYYVRDGYEQMFHLNPLQDYGEAEGWPRIKLWGMGIASRDITDDGLPEVMMTSMGDQLLQINQGGGKMKDAPYSIGTYATTPYLGDDGRPSTGWHAEFGDIDNDGLADLFIAKGNVDQMPSNAIHDPNNLLMQKPDHTFVENGEGAGIATVERSRGAGLADLNGDGLLDIVVMNRRAPMEVWQNQTVTDNHWLTVDLWQDGANRRAVGAWVELRIDGRVQSQEITVGGGHVSGQALPLHFGMGPAVAADLRIVWPDGVTSDWVPVETNGQQGRALTLTREAAGFRID